MLQRRGDSGGRGIDEVAATTRADDEEKERGERGGRMGGLGFVSRVGEGFIRLEDSLDGRHGGHSGHGGADARHVQALPPLCTEMGERPLVGLGCVAVALGLQCTVMRFYLLFQILVLHPKDFGKMISLPQ